LARIHKINIKAYLKGIGASKAEAIVAYRKSNGNFKTLTDLKKVPGIGEETYKNVKSKISTSKGKSTAPEGYKLSETSGKKSTSTKKKTTSAKSTVKDKSTSSKTASKKSSDSSSKSTASKSTSSKTSSTKAKTTAKKSTTKKTTSKSKKLEEEKKK